MSRRLPTATVLLAAAVSMSLTIQNACAQASYPAKTVRLVVPYPPGASADMFGRLVGQRLSESFGQTVIVDNRGGANGAIGAANVAKSPPDGYSLLLNTSSFATNAAVQPKLPFDPIADFSAVGMIAKGPLLLVVHPSLPVSNVRQLIALARSKPDALTFCSTGSGSIQRFAVEMFLGATNTTMVHVPYKGMGPAATDLVGGQVQLTIASFPSVYGQVKAQRLRALAVTSTERSPFAPELPTVRESGVPSYAAELWWGLFVPAKTSPELIARLGAELRKALDSKEVRDKIAVEGAAPVPLTPAEFQKVVNADIEQWRSVAHKRGIKAD